MPDDYIANPEGDLRAEIWLSDGEHESDLPLAVGVSQSNATPVDIVFCSNWYADGDDVMLEDEMSSVAFELFPHLVSVQAPIHAAAFWYGRELAEKPLLVVETPGKKRLSVVLPSLKPYASSQVQVIGLSGFTFSEPGKYTFRLTGPDGAFCERSLVVDQC